MEWALSECFSVSNGIKQGDILSPKLFNIYVVVLSQKLNEKTVGCSFNGTIINHLHYADDLALIAPSSIGMQKLITECESYAEVYGLKFNELKSVLLSFKPFNFKMNPYLNICLNGAPIPVETSCRYMGHNIANDLNNNEDIRRQLRCFYGRSNMLLRTFRACSYTVKLLLFMSYCGSLYTSSIWCKYTKKQYCQMEVAYNNVCRRFFGYDRFSSASQMFVENRVGNFETRMGRLVYGFRERLNASRNSLVICLMNCVAWSSSELRQKGKNVYICRHELIPNFINPCDVSAKCYFIYNHILLIFFHWMLSATVHCMHLLCISHMYFFPILLYHCIYYVFKYGILCISLHVLWKHAIKIYYYYIILLLLKISWWNLAKSHVTDGVNYHLIYHLHMIYTYSVAFWTFLCMCVRGLLRKHNHKPHQNSETLLNICPNHSNYRLIIHPS